MPRREWDLWSEARLLGLEVGFDHDLDEFGEADVRLPPEDFLRLRGVADQVIDFRGTQHARIDLDETLPVVDIGVLERALEKLLSRMRFPRRDDVVVRLWLLEHHRHSL